MTAARPPRSLQRVPVAELVPEGPRAYRPERSKLEALVRACLGAESPSGPPRLVLEDGRIVQITIEAGSIELAVTLPDRERNESGRFVRPIDEVARSALEPLLLRLEAETGWARHDGLDAALSHGPDDDCEACETPFYSLASRCPACGETGGAEAREHDECMEDDLGERLVNRLQREGVIELTGERARRELVRAASSLAGANQLDGRTLLARMMAADGVSEVFADEAELDRRIMIARERNEVAPAPGAGVGREERRRPAPR